MYRCSSSFVNSPCAGWTSSSGPFALIHRAMLLSSHSPISLFIIGNGSLLYLTSSSLLVFLLNAPGGLNDCFNDERSLLNKRVFVMSFKRGQCLCEFSLFLRWYGDADDFRFLLLLVGFCCHEWSSLLLFMIR